VDEVARTAGFFLRHQARFAGFDLAGNEAQYPCRLFEGAFRGLRAAGAKITIHAGEACGPENIWEAIELLGARRIGHGIASVRDPELMERLRRDSICLEMCPTSNWLTQCVPTLEAHPLPQVLRAGIPVCINTDDPGIFDVSLPGEVEVCRRSMGMTSAEIEQCFGHAERASFL
jgi:adenosine deaminase